MAFPELYIWRGKKINLFSGACYTRAPTFCVQEVRPMKDTS